MVEVHLVKMVWKSKSKYFKKLFCWHFFKFDVLIVSIILLSAEINLVPFGITFIFCVFVGLDQGYQFRAAVI